MSSPDLGAIPRIAEPQLAQLLAELRPNLKAILARARIPYADAGDLLQEIFLGLVRNWQRIDCPRAWLLAALSQSCRYYWLRRQSRPSLQALEATAEEEWLAMPPEVDERRWDLAALAQQLPGELQRLLLLRYVWGLSAVEIAVRLGHRPGSVRKRLHRALAQLARLRQDAEGSSILRP